MPLRIPISAAALKDLCHRHHIRRLAFFGSVLRPDFRPDSDIDVLVEFDPAVPVGFRIFQVEDELSKLAGGHRVQVLNPKYLNHRLRDRILASAEVHHAEG